MKRNNLLGCALSLLLINLSGCLAPTHSGSKSLEKGWTPLLKGDHLDGWYTFTTEHGKNNDPEGIFALKDGQLHIYPLAEEGSHVPFGYIATEKEYADYRLRLQYKWGTRRFGERSTAPRDSGVLYHFVGADKVWPCSVECQIMETDTGSIYTVYTVVDSTVDPQDKIWSPPSAGGLLHTVGSTTGIACVRRAMDLEKPGWNDVEVIVEGDEATHLVNGRIVNRCTRMLQPDPSNPGRLISLRKGKILLQAEGAEIFLRNVEIRPIDPR